MYNVGHYSVVNERKPELKALEIIVAPSLLELPGITRVQVVKDIAIKDEASDLVIEVNMKPKELKGHS